jgi:hypothetical protein
MTEYFVPCHVPFFICFLSAEEGLLGLAAYASALLVTLRAVRAEQIFNMLRHRVLAAAVGKDDCEHVV